MASTSPRGSSAAEGSPRLRRMSVDIDQDKLHRAITILGSSSVAEALDEALDLVLLGDDLNAGIDRLAAAGEIKNFFDDHPEW